MIEKNKFNLLVEKNIFFQDIIQKTILNCQKNKLLEIINTNDFNICNEKLYQINSKLLLLKNNIYNYLKDDKNYQYNTDKCIDELQMITNDFSSILKDYGTTNLEDLLKVCFGNHILEQFQKTNTNNNEKYELLKTYFHPISYKILTKKETIKEKDKEKESNTNDENIKNLDCFEFPNDTKSFYLKLNGLKLYIYNHQKIIVINGLMDNIVVDFMNSPYISHKFQNFLSIDNNYDDYDDIYKNFLYTLNVKDYLVHSIEHLHNVFNGYRINLNSMKNNTITQNIKDFLSYDNYHRRRTLIQLLLDQDNDENIYLSYLLYDLLSTDTNGNIDSNDQIQIYDSFTWFIKKQFKHAIKKMVQYNNEIINFDMNKIPLEQQICFLKVPNNVKEKAMTKLKEIKSKGDDNGSKARQYLDGLLKIPFQIYKREPSLSWMNENRDLFKKIVSKHEKRLVDWKIVISPKEKYTNIEIVQYLQTIILEIEKEENLWNQNHLQQILLKGTKKNMMKRMDKIKNIYDFTNYIKDLKKKDLTVFIDSEIKKMNQEKRIELIHTLKSDKDTEDNDDSNTNGCNEMKTEINIILEKFKNINNYLKNVKSSLDDSVYGHEKAKKQIETIIGQWLNGEQDGYCFGFEGPPGVGKTSLAKYGLSECLKDENGINRPFSMIQMGGDSNGSTLHGHNYTYVGSTWGSIVQIVMDKKCMNPIIFIDEVDKISRTEHGKEITGILTHLLDTTQNDCFQDKYFSGIDLDLSKALFILSYNDVNAIDKILLDRIHRIKFNHLSLQDKLIIANKHILPEIYKKVGLNDVIYINDTTLTYIIEEYTNESGVRKLKEILFEIVGDLNLNMLKKDFINMVSLGSNVILPIEITMEDIKNNYLKDKMEIKHKKIHSINEVGIINGLWANSYGQGGVIPIQARFYPCEEFLHLKLTGMQGDVMKESMNVALTLAWGLTDNQKREEIRKMYNNNNNNNNDNTNNKNNYGIHIHCPEGSTPKDGPSAGTAITTVLYSLLNNKKIKYDLAITGEISLDGTITEIGGLDLKILGGIKAGVKTFLFPKENEKDYRQFVEKYREKKTFEDITFLMVGHINEVFEKVFIE
jgi:endopeptidase La